MGFFQHETITNSKEGSQHDIHGYDMPASAHFFIVVEEVGADGILVRKVYASPNDPHLLAKNLSPQQIQKEVFPEKFGMSPVKPDSTASVAEHVYSSRKHPSSYISTSSAFPDGSPRFLGKTIYIDIKKAEAAGARYTSTAEILKALEEYKAKNPKLSTKIEDICQKVKNIDKEVLIQSKHIPAKAIFTPNSYKAANTIMQGAKLVQFFAIIFTAYDLKLATEESYEIKSMKPISQEIIRQAGGWGGAMAGFKIGEIVGTSIGIETGPGALITGLIGGVVFSTAGYFGADWAVGHRAPKNSGFYNGSGGDFNGGGASGSW